MQRWLLVVALVVAETAPTYAQKANIGFLAMSGSPTVIQALINQGADVNARDQDGVTILMNASAYNPDPKVIAILLSAGADLRARDIHGWTALMYAELNKNAQIIRTLLGAGADLKARDETGATALMYAAMGCPSVDILVALLVLLCHKMNHG